MISLQRRARNFPAAHGRIFSDQNIPYGKKRMKNNRSLWSELELARVRYTYVRVYTCKYVYIYVYIYTLSLFLSLSVSPHLILPRLEAFVYQHGIDAGIISVDSGSEITVPLIPPRFSSDDCPSTPFVTRTRATPSVHSVYAVCTCVCEKKKKVFLFKLPMGEQYFRYY